MNDPTAPDPAGAIGPRSMVRNRGFRALMGAVEAAVLEEVRRRRAERGSREREDIVAMLEHAPTTRTARR